MKDGSPYHHGRLHFQIKTQQTTLCKLWWALRFSLGTIPIHPIPAHQLDLDLNILTAFLSDNKDMI